MNVVFSRRIRTRSRSPSPPLCPPSTPGARAVASKMEQESRVGKKCTLSQIMCSVKLDASALRSAQLEMSCQYYFVRVLCVQIHGKWIHSRDTRKMLTCNWYEGKFCFKPVIKYCLVTPIKILAQYIQRMNIISLVINSKNSTTFPLVILIWY